MLLKMWKKSVLLVVLTLLAGVPAWGGEIRLGIVTTPGSAQYVTAKKFEELVHEYSGGTWSVKLFHSGSLGSETTILDQIRRNAVQMGIITVGPFDVLVPEVRVLEFPFLFDDYAQVDKVLDGEVGRQVLASLERAGLAGLAFSENGFRHVTNRIRPVESVADVQGLKLRVMESELHKEFWRILGAAPRPLGWPIIADLQRGIVDGQENPLSVLVVYRLHEVQPYLSLTGHVYSAHINVANLAWFNSLPPAVRELIGTAAREAARYQRAWNRSNEAEFLQQLKAAGMQVEEQPDKDSFRERVTTLRDSALFSAAGVRALLDAAFAALQGG